MSLDKRKHGVLTLQAIESFLEGLDCPRALTVWILLQSGEHDELSRLEFDPFVYNDMSLAQRALSATKLLSKATFLRTSFDKKEKALETFRKNETKTSLTNNRIYSGRFSDLRTHSVLLSAKNVISRILTSINPDEFADACNWGPGASTLFKRRDASAPRKYDSENHITPSALTFVKDWFRIAYPTWDPKFEVQPYSKVVTVPKNSKTERTIAIEPGINLWFQKGIGTLIRRRLFRAGIDLNDQGHNQRLSRLASKFDNLATVDFSSASDTISTAIVEELLPPHWHALLSAFRSSAYTLDGTASYFHKFSSMGNGFTFELESLIFYSIAVGVCQLLSIEDPTISVFGDDVILPSDAFDVFCSVCEDVGFEINKTKSYSSSYYRESCGSHYWNGCDIKPIFLKEELHGKSEVLKFANNVRRLAHRYGYHSCDRRFRPCWQLLSKSLGRNTPVISEGFGDLALIGNFEESKSAKRAPHGIEGFLVPVWGLIPRTLELESHGVLLAKLRKLGRGGTGEMAFSRIASGRDEGNNIPLSCKTKVAKFRILVPRWTDLGPWL